MKYILIIITTILIPTIIISGQSQVEIKSHVDDLIKEYKIGSVPGIGGAIIKEGKLVHSYVAGIADLETGSKNNLQTKFHIDDLAKQFTVFALMTMVDEGTIGMEDDIQKFIPDFPKQFLGIRVKHLLNHSSGLDDFMLIHRLSGGSVSDYLTKENALAIVFLQDELAYKPGTDFSVNNSDTETLLMSIIIANVSGKSFEDYTLEKVFTPLNMKNTLFVENNNQLLDNVAKSYEEREGEYYRKEILQGISGPTNLYSSVEDMIVWYSYFSQTNTTPLAKRVRRLDESVMTDDGDPYITGWGEMRLGQYFGHAERGLPKDWQFGMIGGYSAMMFKFPEEDIVSFTIGNNDAYNGSTAMNSISLHMEKRYTEPESTDPNLIITTPTTSAKLSYWIGDYYHEKGGFARQIDVKDDTLVYRNPSSELQLLYLGNNRFQAIVESDDKVFFQFSGKGNDRQYTYVSSGSDPLPFRLYQKINYKKNEMEGYEGTYYNAQLSAIYRVAEVDGALVAMTLGKEDVTFTPVVKDVFNSMTPQMTSIRFKSNGNRITKFEVQAYGVSGVEFLKL